MKKEKKVDIKYLGIPNICFSVTEKKDKREKKYIKQRINRGFDDSETWNLDGTIAEFIIPRLKVFKTKLHGYPGDLTEESWNEIIDKMILAFELNLSNKYDWDKRASTENDAKIQEGLDLFAKYFRHLWD